MVELRNVQDFYEYVVPLWFNKDKQVTIELKCAATDDVQKQAREEVGVSPEKISELSFEFLAKHVGEIKGLTLKYKDGRKVEIKTLKDLRENGPPEFYSWVSHVIYTSKSLSELEVKN